MPFCMKKKLIGVISPYRKGGNRLILQKNADENKQPEAFYRYRSHNFNRSPRRTL